MNRRESILAMISLWIFGKAKASDSVEEEPQDKGKTVTIDSWQSLKEFLLKVPSLHKGECLEIYETSNEFPRGVFCVLSMWQDPFNIGQKVKEIVKTLKLNPELSIYTVPYSEHLLEIR